MKQNDNFLTTRKLQGAKRDLLHLISHIFLIEIIYSSQSVITFNIYKMSFTIFNEICGRQNIQKSSLTITRSFSRIVQYMFQA